MIDTKKSRGRPRKLDKAAASKAAMALFWRKGYDAVGISELTEELGVKPPSLYATFGNKAGVLKAAMDTYQVMVGDDFAPAFAAQSLEEFVDQLLACAVRSYTESVGHGCLVLDGTRNATDAEAIAASDRHRDAFSDKIRAKLASLGAQNPTEMATACVVAMTGLSGAARMGFSADSLAKSTALLAQGIAKKPTAL